MYCTKTRQRAFRPAVAVAFLPQAVLQAGMDTNCDWFVDNNIEPALRDGSILGSTLQDLGVMQDRRSAPGRKSMSSCSN